MVCFSDDSANYAMECAVCGPFCGCFRELCRLLQWECDTLRGFGLIIVEATAVTPDGRISPCDLGLWEDSQIDSYRWIAQGMKDAGAVPAIQLNHAGRKGSTSCFAIRTDSGYVSPELGGWQTVAPSELPFGDLPAPRQLTVDEIHDIVNRFRDAAWRAMEAGFEVIEIHAAHGYLLSEFLDPLVNDRDDEYGGSLENRIRIVIEVADAIRSVIRGDMPLFARISATDWAEGGWDLDQSIVLAKALKEHGVDLVDVSTGGILPNVTIPTKPGYQVPFSEQIRKKADVPVTAVGLITKPKQAARILAKGEADVPASSLVSRPTCCHTRHSTCVAHGVMSNGPRCRKRHPVTGKARYGMSEAVGKRDGKKPRTESGIVCGRLGLPVDFVTGSQASFTFLSQSADPTDHAGTDEGACCSLNNHSMGHPSTPSRGQRKLKDKSGVDAHGLGDASEAVTAQQFRESSLQYGDLLRAAVHERRDEHDERGTGANLLIGLFGGEHAADAGDCEPVAILGIGSANELGARHCAGAAGESSEPILGDVVETGAVFLQIRDGHALHVVRGQYVEEFLELRPRLVERHLDERGLRAFDSVERGEQLVEILGGLGERLAHGGVRAGDVHLDHRGAAGGTLHGDAVVFDAFVQIAHLVVVRACDRHAQLHALRAPPGIFGAFDHDVGTIVGQAHVHHHRIVFGQTVEPGAWIAGAGS